MISLIEKLSQTKTTIEAKDWTFLGAGGLPTFTFFPDNKEQIKFFLKNKSKEMKYRTFGAGANILIRDKGYNGVFIRLNKTFRNISLENDEIIVEAGVNTSQLTQFCKIHELGGLEFIATIPGQLGGLTKMNAGISTKEMKDLITWVEFINEYGEIERLTNKECKFQYRKSIFQNNWIITQVGIKKESKKKQKIEEEINILKEHRKATQPTIGKLAGCFFKNPEKEKAWELIKKTKIIGCGKTQISDKHKNFIIANESCNAEEIEYLIETIRAKIIINQNIFLESEVERIGIL